MQCACAALYCHLWPLWVYNISPHYLRGGGNKLSNIKCDSIFSTNFVWNIFHSKNNGPRRDQKCIRVFTLNTLSLSDFTGTFSTDFQKILKSQEKPSSVKEKYHRGLSWLWHGSFCVISSPKPFDETNRLLFIPPNVLDQNDTTVCHTVIHRTTTCKHTTSVTPDSFTRK